MFKSLATLAVIAMASLQSADAHGAMSLPQPNSKIDNSPSGTIDGPKVLQGSFGTSPDANTASFHAAFKAQTKYKTIRDLIYANFKGDGGATKECGRSAATGPPQPLPDFVEYNGNGFDASHEGPCEVWCDETRVFYEENCSKKYTTKPAKLPYDKSKCAGAKRLQSFWLALHVPAWQAYISCATLSGSGGGGGGAAPAPGPAQPNPAPAPEQPYPAPAPQPNPAPTPRPNPAPAQPNPAPAPRPNPAPANPGKCTPKRFRRE